MKEAPSNEGAFLVSATPPSGSLGDGYFKGRGMLIGPEGDPSLGPSGSSSGTWNLAWNFGR